MVRNALANGDFRVKYGSLNYDMRGDQNWAFFATYSTTQTNHSQSLEKIPKNFIEHFRTLNHLNPHLSYILTLHFELYGVHNPLQTANKIVTFFQILDNAMENQCFFLSEKLSIEDVELVQALNIRPSLSMVNQIIRSLQQMIISQTALKINVPEIWKAIKECLSNLAAERAMKLILTLFNTVFQSDIIE